MPGVDPPTLQPPVPVAAPAWSSDDLAADPHHRADKQERVRKMFAAIAGSYDLNNRLHSFGLDQRWRKFVVKRAEVKPTEDVLDVACGTGDLTRAFAAAGARRVVGLDYTQEMIDIAGTKQLEYPRPQGAMKLTYLQGDAQKLPFTDACFDIVSIAFGIRNVQDPSLAVAEFFRVLRPGGRLMVLEFDRPRNPLIRWGNDLYTKRIMPLTATLISRDKSGAYKYLPKSVESFLDRDALGALIRERGFASHEAHALTFGVCVCHRAMKG